MDRREHQVSRLLRHLEEGHKDGFPYITSAASLHIGTLKAGNNRIKQVKASLPCFYAITFHDATTQYLLSTQPFPGSEEHVWFTASKIFRDAYLKGFKMHKKLYIPKRLNAKRQSQATYQDCEECKVISRGRGRPTKHVNRPLLRRYSLLMPEDLRTALDERVKQEQELKSNKIGASDVMREILSKALLND